MTMVQRATGQQVAFDSLPPPSSTSGPVSTTRSTNASLRLRSSSGSLAGAAARPGYDAVDRPRRHRPRSRRWRVRRSLAHGLAEDAPQAEPTLQGLGPRRRRLPRRFSRKLPRRLPKIRRYGGRCRQREGRAERAASFDDPARHGGRWRDPDRGRPTRRGRPRGEASSACLRPASSASPKTPSSSTGPTPPRAVRTKSAASVESGVWGGPPC